MTEMLSHNNETIFAEVVSRGREQGVTTQVAFDDLVEEVIEEHRSLGEIHDDEPTEDMEEQLRDMWSRYVEMLDLGSDQPQL